MGNFVNKLDLSDPKYQTNGNIRDKNYKGNFLVPMKDFVSSITDSQSMDFVSTRFLKNKINRIRVLIFKLPYIRNTTYLSH